MESRIDTAACSDVPAKHGGSPARARVLTAAVVGLVLGGVLAVWADRALFGRTAPTIADHWRLLNDYNAYMNDAANRERDTTNRLTYVSVPRDLDGSVAPEYSLRALADAGELIHAELVLTTVPYASEPNKYWMVYCQTHPEILHVTGKVKPTGGVKVAGEFPLQLNIWYRPEHEHVVQTLVNELEEKFGRK